MTNKKSVRIEHVLNEISFEIAVLEQIANAKEHALNNKSPQLRAEGGIKALENLRDWLLK